MYIAIVRTETEFDIIFVSRHRGFERGCRLKAARRQRNPTFREKKNRFDRDNVGSSPRFDIQAAFIKMHAFTRNDISLTSKLLIIPTRPISIRFDTMRLVKKIFLRET